MGDSISDCLGFQVLCDGEMSEYAFKNRFEITLNQAWLNFQVELDGFDHLVIVQSANEEYNITYLKKVASQ